MASIRKAKKEFKKIYPNKVRPVRLYDNLGIYTLIKPNKRAKVAFVYFLNPKRLPYLFMTRRQNLEKLQHGKLAIEQVCAQHKDPNKFLDAQTSLSQAQELSQAFNFQYGKDPSGKINKQFWVNYLKQLNNE